MQISNADLKVRSGILILNVNLENRSQMLMSYAGKMRRDSTHEVQEPRLNCASSLSIAAGQHTPSHSRELDVAEIQYGVKYYNKQL